MESQLFNRQECSLAVQSRLQRAASSVVGVKVPESSEQEEKVTDNKQITAVSLRFEILFRMRMAHLRYLG